MVRSYDWKSGIGLIVGCGLAIKARSQGYGC